MSLTYITICDGCGKRTEGWPQGEDAHDWISASQSSSLAQWNYCTECWAKMREAIAEAREGRK